LGFTPICPGSDHEDRVGSLRGGDRPGAGFPIVAIGWSSSFLSLTMRDNKLQQKRTLYGP
jgi:hypothetical protein